MPFYEPVIIARREFGALTYLSLGSPELARSARPGQQALARCAPPGSADPLLRRPIFFAGADPAAGTVSLLIDPHERGLAWLAAQPVGARLDLLGPLGTPFTLDQRTRNLLLVGAGPALAALIFLAATASAHGAATVLLAAAPAADRLPPPFLLPAESEYQSSDEGPAGLLGLLVPAPPKPASGRKAKAALPPPPAPPPISWADQLCAALPEELLVPTADAVRAARLRWERGFAQVALAGPAPCGVGACQACLVETRDGLRARCKDGPVFDLRDLR